MVSSDRDGGAVSDRRMSTVVPAEVVGDSRLHELTNMDLAMKLHYLRMVYYFAGAGAAAGLTAAELKYPMFKLLELYYPMCGRIRRSESGRPVVKCNDSGVRVVEAKCGTSLEEWLAAGEHRPVVADNVIGPDVNFSPLVVVQFTRFKCGGLAIGVSWSHLLGGAACAVNFINTYGQALSGISPPRPEQPRNPPARAERPALAAAAPVSVTKRANTVQDRWLPATESKMDTFTFHLTATHLKKLQSKTTAHGRKPFELISAFIWQSLAKLRGSNAGELGTITVCKSSASAARSWVLGNEQAIGTVRARSSPSKTEVSELAQLIAEGFADESAAVEAQVDTETGEPDLVVYGANLTFVDVEEVEAYGMAVKGQAPVFVNYSMEGVGDEGCVLVFQGGKAEGGDGGVRAVNVVLPEGQVSHLRKEMEREWGIA